MSEWYFVAAQFGICLLFLLGVRKQELLKGDIRRAMDDWKEQERALWSRSSGLSAFAAMAARGRGVWHKK